MLRFDRSQQDLAIGISALAGFVDALGFVESSGFFVSFMTGNSTRLAVGAAEGTRAGLIAGAIILLFVGGVVTGSLVGARFAARRARAVLALVTALLAAATALRFAGLQIPAIAGLAVAMGAVNATLQGRDGSVVGVTYMTGTLVQMGQKMANRLRGSGDGRWVPHLLLWAGLVLGAVAGAWTVLRAPAIGYALAVAFAAALTVRAATNGEP